jgi:transcriptional regulator with XRE-family HTH domain
MRTCQLEITQLSNFGERLKEERERKGMTQDAFGAVGGVRKQAQLKYEKAERKPDVEYFEALSKIGVDVQYVVTGQRSGAALSQELADLIRLYQSASIEVKAAAIRVLSGGAASGSTVSVHAPHGHASAGDMVFGGKIIKK